MVKQVDPGIIENLHKKFTELDDNGDGKIQLHEIKKKLVDISGGEAIIEVLKGADIDRDGEISYEEFMLSLTDANFFLDPKNIKDAFKYFDKNDDGAIDIDEFKSIIHTGDEDEEDMKLAEDSFRLHDLDGDGKIDIEEFKKLIIDLLNRFEGC